MSITVNTNISSIIAQRSLYKSTNKMNTALERLSTGLRINSAKDDAAGSAISTKLEYKMSSYDVAKDNAQMGQSMLDTANGTLSNINSMLQRMRDLSEQASNGTYGEDERKAMQSEINGLTEEIYRIKNTTEFNGKKILGEETVNKMTEAEAIANGYTVVKTAKELYSAFHNTDGSQKLDAKVMLFADIDLNELGDLDGNGSNWEAIGKENNSYTGTFDGNGYTISNLKITNKSSEKYQGFFGFTSNSEIKNTNLKNVFVSGIISGGFCGRNDGGYYENCSVEGTIIGTSNDCGIFIGVNNLSTSKIINCSSYGVIESSSPNFIGGLVGHNIGGYIENCYTSSVVKGVNNASIGALVGRVAKSTSEIKNSYCDLEKSGQTSAIGAIQDGAIADKCDAKDSKINPFTPKELQIKTNLQVGIDSSNDSVISVDTGFSLGDFNVSVLNEYSARNSLDKIDAMMNKVMAKMTEIGATQNRLESTMEFQEVQRNALTSANSLIKDADIAEESSSYIKNQILQNVTATLLATANQNPSVALQLI